MSKKRMAASLVVVLVAILMNVCIVRYSKPASGRSVNVEVTLEADEENGYQWFYSPEDVKTPAFAVEKSIMVNYQTPDKQAVLEFTMPGDTTAVRLDFGSGKSITTIHQIRLYNGSREQIISGEKLQDIAKTQMVTIKTDGDNLVVEASKDDPYVIWDASEWRASEVSDNSMDMNQMIVKILACLVLDLMVLVFLKFFKKIVMLPVELFQNRKLIFDLAKNDFKTQFAGSYLGIVWAFVQPVVTVLVYWFVFEKGLKAGAMNTKAGINVPFVLWLVAGIVPWFFFQDALNGGTNALTQYSYLVKKVVFKISILPIVKVISALFVHLFFIAFTVVLYAAYHNYPDLYTLQIVYYSFCMILFVLGIVYATCAIVVFFKDLTQIINIVLQVGIWMTPIMWNIDTMDLNPILITIFKLNPMYYVVSGYRDSLINKIGFWENPELTLYFWIVTAILFGLGSLIFRRLKVHFADVL